MTKLAEPLSVPVSLGNRSYDILIGSGLLSELGQHVASLTKQKRVFVVSDETVWDLYEDDVVAALKRAGLTSHVHTVAPGESSKSWKKLGKLLNKLLDEGAGRDDVLVAFGGGVVGDLAGLAASLLKRGMSLVQVPTTLLAQVDSSVGGKTAVNAKHGKNLIGAFYQPKLVLADTALLKTLSAREVRAGYAEVVKYGLIDDMAFTNWLDDHGQEVLSLEDEAVAHAVAVSCQAKARIVARDEQEGGVRALLNFGHTFGHTLEAANGYGHALLHGEAVATGMALAMRYSTRLGLMSKDDADRGTDILARCGLQTDLSRLIGGPYEVEELIDAMRQDKKVRAGRVPLILARGIGKAFIHPDADLDDVAAFLSEELQQG
ncbi:MAG: 3-dehydroquinate synthase [Pseudomonadota bacterium]